jgi:hypothetical protein
LFPQRREGRGRRREEGRRESSFVHGRHMNQVVGASHALNRKDHSDHQKLQKKIVLQFTTSSLLVISAQHVTARLSFTINHSFLAWIPFTDVATKAQMNSRTVLCPDASDSIMSSTSIASLSQHEYSSSNWSQPWIYEVVQISRETRDEIVLSPRPQTCPCCLVRGLKGGRNAHIKTIMYIGTCQL